MGKCYLPLRGRAAGFMGTPDYTAEVDGHASGDLSVAQCTGTIIHNIGQGANDITLNLPAAAPGMSFVAHVGEPSANFWKFTAPTSGRMIVDGVSALTSAYFATPAIGDFFTAFTMKAAPQPSGILTGAALGIGTTPANVANGAFTYYIGQAKYSKAGVAAGTAPGNDVIPSGKYGAVALDINAAGTISAIEAAANAAGYDTAGLAIAGLPAVAAGLVRIGTVTAMKSDGNFTFGTTALNAANTTVAYTSAAAYTAVYRWVVNAGNGILSGT